MKEAFEGTAEKIIYTNEENGYSVFSFDCPKGLITAAGTLPGVIKGRRYQLEGEFRQHPRFGTQFVFSLATEVSSVGADSIAAFLASGVIKGIGPVMAEAIVRKFGEDTADIIANHPEKLTQVSGIGEKKAAAIAEGYASHKAYADLVMELAPFGVSAAVCMKLFKLYGASALDNLKKDPYSLTRDAAGFGFVKADAIAMKMGVPPEDPRRLKSAVLYYIDLCSENGSTFVYESDFTEETARRLQVSREALGEAVFDLVMDGDLIKENLDGSNILMRWYLYELEQQSAAKLFALAHASLPHISGNAENLIAACEKRTGIRLSEKQKNAVISSIKNGVSVITGGPGTGKTTIINALLDVLDGAGVKTLLAAPTGRAAKRMAQATGRQAATIHRLLEASYVDDEERMCFMRDCDNPLECGCVVIDETSMVDTVLMAALLDAIEPGTRLILVGDADQLPSVGPGSVLKDIIESETIHSIRLTEIFRQAAESAIVTNAHAINRGEYPSYNAKNTDFFFMEKPRQGDVLELIKDLCARRLPAFYSELDPFSDIQVLTPTKKDVLGSRNLNKELQQVLNPAAEDKPQLTWGEKIFRLGDKLIQTKNDYTLDWISKKDMSTGRGVFNGDIGVIEAVDAQNGQVFVLYDDEKLVKYDFSTFDEIDPAYALTVHKSQGCEFPVVVMPVYGFMPVLTTRNLLYTAITRAKQAVILVGRQAVCCAMVDNDPISTRNSGLAKRLRRLWDYEYGIR